ncbi:glycerate kinase [Ectobacillus polymachus]|uniref:glycerate kinase n=1 Tax=Ectobacillus polymachus TaxID=1508806 RepID=UPI003A8388CE
MKVIIAIDSFKGSIASIQAAQAVALGITDVYPDAKIVAMPMADGGEGTAQALVAALHGQMVKAEVTGPLGERLEASYGLAEDMAVIEVAAACGLPLVPEEKRNPLETTTYGVGELIRDAMERGCRRFLIGLGGSATNDAGIGMLQALGFSFRNENGQEVGFGGKELQSIRTILFDHVHPLLHACTFQVACDVSNPLYGQKGAACVFAPQKGATPRMVEELDAGLKHFAKVVETTIHQNVQIAGAGAAGGLGAAFALFLHGVLESGIDVVLEMTKLEDHMQGADFVITGEGKLDLQTVMGKVPQGVARLAQKYDVPVIGLAGAAAGDLSKLGLTAYFSITPAPMSFEEAMKEEETFHNLRITTRQIFSLVAISKR